MARPPDTCFSARPLLTDGCFSTQRLIPPLVRIKLSRSIGEEEFWSRGRELNSRPADYESAALPLSYLGLVEKSTLASTENWCQFIRKTLFARLEAVRRQDQRENGYIAQPMPIPNSKNRSRDHTMYFARSIGRRRLRNPNAMDIISANSNIACRWLRWNLTLPQAFRPRAAS